MKERPILMSAPMVRAIQAGTKTQTRRICKGFTKPGAIADMCPYGKPGDRLWVREAWRPRAVGEDWSKDIGTGVVYRATENLDGLAERWRPSIHMPRAASRITLEVTGVRVEQLQDISATDAMAEGIEWKPITAGKLFVDYSTRKKVPRLTNARAAYASLWESINGKGSWDANPWVWVVEFQPARSQA